MNYKRKEIIGDCTLYLGDNKDLIDHIECDAIVTDPPYGINYTGNGGKGWINRNATFDRERPNKEIFEFFVKFQHAIIWGGNYFADYLPTRMMWLCWDKGQRNFSLADVELAWTSYNKASRIITFSRSKALQDEKKHPTQKPVEVMKWCISHLPDTCQTIFDPFMGSGTTLVACAKMGRKGIGIEIDEGYFDIACKRVEDAYKQPDMFGY